MSYATLAAAGLEAGGSPSGMHGGTRPLHTYPVAYVLHRSAQAASQQQLVMYSRTMDLIGVGTAANLYELSWVHGIESVSSTGSQTREVIARGKLQALEIVSVARAPHPVTLEFWVDPRTYLPVRTLLDSQDTFPAVDRVDEHTDYEWLAPTTANLAKLAVRIPAGFRRDGLQPVVNFCGFIPCN